MGMLPVSVGLIEVRSDNCGHWGRTAIHGDTVRYADTSRNHDSVTHQLPCNLPTGYKGKRSEVTQRCSGGTDEAIYICRTGCAVGMVRVPWTGQDALWRSRCVARDLQPERHIFSRPESGGPEMNLDRPVLR
jgi:hypothetical protein